MYLWFMTKEKIYKFLEGKSPKEMYDDLKSIGLPHEKSMDILSEVLGEPVIRFKDLKFELHPMSFRYDKQKAIRSHGLIKNKWYSIVGGGKGLYGDGVNNFEIWTEKLHEDGDGPIGYCEPYEIEYVLLDLY